MSRKTRSKVFLGWGGPRRRLAHQGASTCVQWDGGDRHSLSTDTGRQPSSHRAQYSAVIRSVAGGLTLSPWLSSQILEVPTKPSS